MAKTYSKEFKVDALKLAALPGNTLSKVARDLGVAKSVIYKWKQEADKHQDGAFVGKGRLNPQDEEIRRLRRELERTRMERDILKKATAFFAKDACRG